MKKRINKKAIKISGVCLILSAMLFSAGCSFSGPQGKYQAGNGDAVLEFSSGQMKSIYKGREKTAGFKMKGSTIVADGKETAVYNKEKDTVETCGILFTKKEK